MNDLREWAALIASPVFLLELATLFLMAACCVGLPVVMAS
jgi:hypothetical protein